MPHSAATPDVGGRIRHQHADEPHPFGLLSAARPGLRQAAQLILVASCDPLSKDLAQQEPIITFQDRETCRVRLKPVAADIRVGSMLSKKSFGGSKRNFLKRLMRCVRSNVRDHIVSRKNDHGPSYRHYRASQRRSSPKITICEIFGVVRFSTFSTASVRSGHSRRFTRCPLFPQKRTSQRTQRWSAKGHKKTFARPDVSSTTPP